MEEVAVPPKLEESNEGVEPDPIEPSANVQHTKDDNYVHIDEVLSELSTSDEDDDTGIISLKRYLRELEAKEPDSVPKTSPRVHSTGFKIAISNLPGSMDVEGFVNYFGELPTHDYFFYKPSLSFGDSLPFCTAVINFVQKEDAAYWIQMVDGIVLVDQYEVEYEVECYIVDNQDLPKNPVVDADELEGTLEEAEDFLEFQDQCEDTDGVFKDPPIPADVLQETMLKEIDEKKARQAALQDTPLVKCIQEQLAVERDKRREREEAAEAQRKAKDKRRAERKEREKESKRESAAKEKLRKEAARRARKSAKKSQTPPSKTGSSAPTTPRTGEDPPVSSPNEPYADATPGTNTQEKANKETGAHAHDRNPPRRNDSRRSSRANRNSRQWDRDPNWRSASKPKPEPKSNRSDETFEDPNPAQAVTPSSSSTTATVAGKESTEVRRDTPKKKIVKKIVKVKKVKSGDTVTTVVVTEEASKKSDVTATAAAPSASTSSVDTAQPPHDRPKKGGRPDREVYRPGAWRRNSGQSQSQGAQMQKPTTSTNKGSES